MNYAYIRVSDAKKQDASAQNKAIMTYCNENKYKIDRWFEFNLSGSKTSREERGITDLIDLVKAGDRVVVSDVARLGRDDIHQLVNTITSITTRGASIHFAYSKKHIGAEDANDISKMFIIIGESFAAVKMAQERSIKAKTAIKVRKEKGLRNGRRVGEIVKTKLDPYFFEIKTMRDTGKKVSEIMKIINAKSGLNVNISTYYRFINQRL